MKEKPISFHLERAKATIGTPDRWCKHKMWDGGIRYCSLGAIKEITNWYRNPTSGEQAKDILRKAINQINGRHWSIGDFNDDPSTTHADVMEAFERAIQIAKEKGL